MVNYNEDDLSEETEQPIVEEYESIYTIQRMKKFGKQ